MQNVIELALESADGTVDCQLERKKNENGIVYSVTILYPHLTNGIMMSKVYEHTMVLDRKTGKFAFSGEEGPTVHPKVKILESQLADAISLHG
jgi:hypothetical protein